MALHVCVRGIGIRRSKDLRAEIRKFLISTNERKQMSTKTLRKRIALVAVAALGAGVLSVAPANATATALVAGDYNFTAITLQPGVCVVTNGTAVGTTSAVVVAGSSFKLDGFKFTKAYVSVSGNATVAAAGTAFETLTLEAATSTDAATDNTAAVSGLTFRAGAVGTAKISVAVDDATTAVDVLSVTVVAACDAGTTASGTFSFSQAQDAAKAVANGQGGTGFGSAGARLTNNTDGTGSTVVTLAEGSGYLLVSLQGAYNQVLPTGAVVATITSGDANVNVADAGAAVPAAGKAKTAVAASTGEQLVVRVSPATAGAPTVATVSVSYGGAVVATKTFTFQGVATRIAVTDVTAGSTVDGYGAFRYQIFDAAGNALFSRAIANDSTANAPTAVSSITSGIVVNSSSTAADGSKSDAATGTNPARFNCSAAGTTTVNASYSEAANPGVTIKTSFPISCGGALDTWTISMDKATYAPGEIATLTLSGKDVKGFAAATSQSLSGVAFSFGGMTAVTAPTDGDKFSSGLGIKTYQFSVGTTEGAFVGTFKTTGATDTAAKTVQYKIANAVGTTSNADVLKAIVSLIASINKQIAALQKALLRR
jgi:trimeric autotransporter adhesin